MACAASTSCQYYNVWSFDESNKTCRLAAVKGISDLSSNDLETGETVTAFTEEGKNY